MHKYTPEEIAFLEKNVKGRTHPEVTCLFNAHFGLELRKTKIRAALHNRHLTSGIDCKFKPGDISHSPPKGTHYSRRTEFKPGSIPANYRPVGSERVDVDGYVWVKTQDPKTWRMKHVMVWEAKNGPVPKGYVVIFADGNRLNIDIDNLLLVSRGQLAVLNHSGLLQKNKALNESALLTVDLMMKIAQLRKKKGNNRKGE